MTATYAAPGTSPRYEYHKQWREDNIRRTREGRAIVPHGAAGYHMYGCRCDRCRKAAVRTNAEYLAQTPPGSGSNNGQRWSEDHLEIVHAKRADGTYELCARECAELLGRTISAINGQRAARSKAERGIS